MFTAGGVLAVGGCGHLVVAGVGSGIDRVDPFGDLKNRPSAGRGLNFLVVGVDRRDGFSKEERHRYRLGGAACNCTDTMMLVHLSEDRKRASVVSLPRDTYAVLPAHTDPATGERRPETRQKLNAAYTRGGPGLTVRTVERMTGVHVHHYLEVDFTSFMRTVDVLGGVEVCSVRPLKDKQSGLDLPAGKTRLNGPEALAYVRARSVDGSADMGRMQRQQRFLASVVDQAVSDGVLLNPMRFQKVGSAMLDSVRADRNLGNEEMLALGRAMRDFDASSAEFTTVPLAQTGYQVKGLGETVRWHKDNADKLFSALREDRPLAPVEEGEREAAAKEREERRRAVPVEVAPATIRVQVDNGTGRAGLGHRVDTELRDTGFQTTGIPGNAERGDVETTEIAYDPRWDRSAKALAAALPGAELRKVKGQGPLMRVTLGADFTEVTPVREAEPAPDPAAQREHGYSALTGDQVSCG
ncbi:LCP family protein [Streptomyces durbertensis]|uniref:LCP family protein n=1 Tax=Streptomyces durbertensis TaxID=2448886 RepID=A0ABR6EG20_9ACTN|nr:LCP family protein [Streptomyces durbertensis]MBB1244257.1 LCP family protein [Streptomyces durbertensis]